jgi:hypothetical protein
MTPLGAAFIAGGRLLSCAALRALLSVLLLMTALASPSVAIADEARTAPSLHADAASVQQTAGAPIPAPVTATQAAVSPVDIHVFWRAGCPHCEEELAFLAQREATHPWLRVHRHEVMSSRAARELFVRTANSLGTQAVSVPFTVIGDDYVTGYLDDASTGASLLALAEACRARACRNRVTTLLTDAAASPSTANTGEQGDRVQEPATQDMATHTSGQPPVPPSLQLPLLGEIRTAHLSLPLLTITLAAIDGFNPCAMWALVFLLGLLVGLKDRRRMWLLGTTFVVASALVYFLFMTAWLNLVLFIGAVAWLRLLIGLLAVGGGLWYLYEWKTHRDEQCQVSAAPARRRILDGLRELSTRPQLALAMAGIVALAFAVNLIELVCSAGIPAVYTQVLAMTPMPPAAHYGYLALYILVFMLDDLFVLAATLFTLQVTGVTSRYTHTATLIGGIVLLLLGLVMVFRPAWLSYSG